MSRESLFSFAAAVVCCLVAAITSICFLSDQSLWTDEMTQMRGLGLDVSDLFHWLLYHEPDLGVPYDRMPPGSYLLGMGWAELWGSGAWVQRVLGAVLMVIATALLFSTIGKHYGLIAAASISLLFALSPGLTVLSVEIRAYPLFLLLSVAAFACYLDVWQSGRGLGVLVCTLAAACWTHFFGFVLSGALLLPLAVRWWPNVVVRRRLLTAAGFWLVAVAGVLPFVWAAVGASPGEPVAIGAIARDLVRLAYRLVSHASITLQPAFVIVGLVGVALLFFAAILNRKEAGYRLWAPGAALAAGGAAVALGAFVLKGFSAASPWYNIWMIAPLFGIWAAALLRGRLGQIGVVLVAIAYLAGSYNLIQHGRSFAHGPYEQVAALVVEPTKSAVVYTSDSDQAEMTAIAMRYFRGRGLRQYRQGDDGFMRDLGTGKVVSAPFADIDRLFFVDSRALGHKQLVAAIRTGGDAPGHTLDGWHVEETHAFTAWTAASVSVLRRE